MENNNLKTQTVSIRDAIETFLSNNENTKTAYKVMDLLNDYSSVSEFVSASEGSLMSKYMSRHPNAKKGLGQRTFGAIQKVREFVADYKKSEADRIEAEKERIAKENEQNPVFSKKQLKAILDFMDYCNVEQIDLKGAMRFFKSFGIESLPFGDGKTKV